MMEKLPLSVAKKLAQLKAGESLAGSKLTPSWLYLLQQEEIVAVQRVGRTKTRLSLISTDRLTNFLSNQLGIANLEAYVKMLEQKEATGFEASEIATNTKLRYARTFKGFLVNVTQVLETQLNHAALTLKPQEGAFTFIYDYENFKIAPQVTIIGVENPESFSHLKRHLYLFPQGDKLFVSRYPQNLDVLRWLRAVPNPYLHFGDLDLAGIAIFENEYRKHLGARASLLIPLNFEKLLAEKGSRPLYNQQSKKYGALQSDDENVQALINSIHRLKKGVEQERLVR